MAKSMEQLMELIDKIPDEPAKAGEFILPELMAIQIAHAVRDDDIVFRRHRSSHGGDHDGELPQRAASRF